MNSIRQFELNSWIDTHENHDTLDMSTTVSSPALSIDDLIALSTDSEATRRALSLGSVPLTYGDPNGSEDLRHSIASLYTNSQVTSGHIITTSGAVAGNHIVFSALICPGDHIICMYPVYEQLYKISQALGAEVTFWKLKESNGWSADMQCLRQAIRENTKMIVLCSPNNPTGAYLPTAVQHSILKLVEVHDIILMVDEVFRPMFHFSPNHEEEPASFLESGYEKCIVTSSCSKSYGLPGIRVGWIATLSNDFIRRFTQIRNYTTISVGLVDEIIAAEVLSPRCRLSLLQRSSDMAKANLRFLREFVAKNQLITWTPTHASTSTLIRLHNKDGSPLNDQEFALEFLKANNILFCPASLCFEEGGQGSLQGYLRLGFVMSPATFRHGLEKLADFVEAWPIFNKAVSG
ncbi:capreomycidine synthase [Aspergillus lentulus]|uniref:Capreomycidine synthase n=2 Tax=Aspergillus lentulus TaxID=293939 RepID=A0ABQ1ATZ4_ASPLE|nr:capreomycidine synthase [Aspergillus lentulus]GFF87994.1 capreomycidine synthase [Aspergillus lentulus]